MKTDWEFVTSGISQVSVLGLTLVNIFVNDLDSAMECTFSSFVDDTKLGVWSACCSVGLPFRGDPHQLDKQAGRNLMKFSKGTCSVLHLI